MCGRYALALRASQIRAEFEGYDMPVDEVPDDDATRQSYNVAPGYYESVYRADVPDWGAGGCSGNREVDGQDTENVKDSETHEETGNPKETRYKIQAMKWGLVPFWTKRNPDYGSLMRTINCRDDSLLEDRGMWTTMKKKKRCIVMCQGFYEWLKKNDGKEKLPHFIKRKDGKLMCFAGLWDCAQYEGSDERLYTYTIITTSSNDQMKFIHDRMPVILENGSEDLRTWLDPGRATWSKELQSLLKPYKGELEIYPVSKEVGKVGNNSPSFIIPLTSTENKNNIANFFQSGKTKSSPKSVAVTEAKSRRDEVEIKAEDAGDERKTLDQEGSEHNAPVPIPQDEEARNSVKRERDTNEEQGDGDGTPRKSQKPSMDASPLKAYMATRKTRSATSNTAARTIKKGSPKKGGDGSQPITNFFGK
ncbi:MAG: hypothetical protein M1825_006199 [Sarcosagium campestre]|nr:MAG: hypothetical protein M1825_006199 [Sarcosagium campestre]